MTIVDNAKKKRTNVSGLKEAPLSRSHQAENTGHRRNLAGKQKAMKSEIHSKQKRCCVENWPVFYLKCCQQRNFISFLIWDHCYFVICYNNNEMLLKNLTYSHFGGKILKFFVFIFKNKICLNRIRTKSRER